ncbi:hypothetical protein AB0G73_18825 [Streptomyces sp. NPDC020719]|uniref:hypothetical protein n=1 Tax=Streptomyces sp. NPDC020719 TaxID=3154896 RepID=UPI0033CAE1BD
MPDTHIPCDDALHQALIVEQYGRTLDKLLQETVRRPLPQLLKEQHRRPRLPPAVPPRHHPANPDPDAAAHYAALEAAITRKPRRRTA